MDYDYSKRGLLLPDGCKDLIDLNKDAETEAVVTQITVTEHNFIVTARLPELNDHELEIVVDGRCLRIVGQPSGATAFESVVEVPPGYRINAARAVYILGNLRIVVPKDILAKRSRTK